MHCMPPGAAVEEGILPGGGVALLRAGKALDKLKGENEDQRHGVEIVKKAISWPARQRYSRGRTAFPRLPQARSRETSPLPR